jgi:hypothetical protein
VPSSILFDVEPPATCIKATTFLQTGRCPASSWRPWRVAEPRTEGRFAMSGFSRVIKWFLLIAGGIVTQLLLSSAAHTALGAEPPSAAQDGIVLDQQLIHQLRLFEKEIARSQYTEFCATVTMPPPGRHRKGGRGVAGWR